MSDAIMSFNQEDLVAHISSLPEQSRFHYPLRHRSLKIGIYAPVGKDDQTPHKQDELYIIISGNGVFEQDGSSIPFAPGDVLFVKAGITHRFAYFSNDFKTWVVFWGPEGGE